MEKQTVFFEKMLERVNQSKDLSDTDMFNSLMYLGEFFTKISALTLIASLSDDKHRTRESYLCQIVRASGIGDWSKIIDEILVGPSVHLIPQYIQSITREITQNFQKGTWQYDSNFLIRECLNEIKEEVEAQQIKVQGRNWFQLFAWLRNKTRGHGAEKSQTLSRVCPFLEESILLILNNFSLFKTQDWAYISRHYSGKYRLSYILNKNGHFDFLKSLQSEKTNLEEGIYIFFDKPVRIALFETDLDLMDFYVPNGHFKNETYDVISYISSIKEQRDNTKFLIPPNSLPGSETEGGKNLEVVEQCFTNLPKFQSLYINRKDLEKELYELLINERHPIITLFGRGGIGKTSLALKVLNEICQTERFDIILWFSARDIDLLEEGGKIVKPQVINMEEIVSDFVKLIPPKKSGENKSSKKYVENQLSQCEYGKLLVVIDNFETIENPAELFVWFDTHIRLPNKVLITSRIKDSRGDYPVKVSGMEIEEFEKLVNSVSAALKIDHLVTKDFINSLYQETGGHPYMAKIMLGEVAKEKGTGSIKRIAAGKDELLTALFERTFNMLSPTAKLVFLTLASWRSIIPTIGVEAIIKTKSEDYHDVEDAIEELHNFSFIEKIKIEKDNSEFLFLPLATYLFGQKKLNVSPFKPLISEYIKYLNFFGVGHAYNIDSGIQPRISLFFEQVSKQLSLGKKYKQVDEFNQILEYICHKYPNAWLLLSDLYERHGSIDQSINACQKYLQYEVNNSQKMNVWRNISLLARKANKHFYEAHALIEMCNIPKSPFEVLINSAKRIFFLLDKEKIQLNASEKKIILTKIIDVLSSRIANGEGNDNDKCELAWLYLFNQQLSEARKITSQVLKANPNNFHAQKLKKKLKIN